MRMRNSLRNKEEVNKLDTFSLVLITRSLKRRKVMSINSKGASSAFDLRTLYKYSFSFILGSLFCRLSLMLSFFIFACEYHPRRSIQPRYHFGSQSALNVYCRFPKPRGKDLCSSGSGTSVEVKT